MAKEVEVAIGEGGLREEVANALTNLEAALAVVIETARNVALIVTLPSEAPSLDDETLRSWLIRLLGLLKSNDLKATDEFQALRPSLEAANTEAPKRPSPAVDPDRWIDRRRQSALFRRNAGERVAPLRADRTVRRAHPGGHRPFQSLQ